jgi:RHS repeat-associated protein
MSDAAGTIQSHYSYEPFGRTTADGAVSVNRMQFSGREAEAGGLYHYRARYYDAGIQRFISEDPLGFGGDDGMNLHAYAGNNPLNRTDPLGDSETQRRSRSRTGSASTRTGPTGLCGSGEGILDRRVLWSGSERGQEAAASSVRRRQEPEATENVQDGSTPS